MANTEGPSSFISISLSLLEEQEKEYKSVTNRPPLKDHIVALKLGLRSLEIFNEISNSDALKRRIRRVGYGVRLELHSLSGRPKNTSLIKYLDNAYSNLREKMKKALTDPGTGEYEAIFLKFFISNTFLKRIRDFILEKISSCMAHSVKEKLLLLRALVKYVEDSGVNITDDNKELLTPLVELLERAACLLYSSSVGKIDEEMELVMNHNLFNLLKIDSVKEIWITVLRCSKFVDVNKHPLESEFHFTDNLIKLLYSTSNFVVHLNDASGATLRDKFKFLGIFLADLPYEVMIERFDYLVPSFEAITCTTLDALYSCYDEDMKVDNVVEMKDALAEVIDKIEDIQAEVGEIKVYNYPKTDVLGFLDLFVEYIDELLTHRLESIEALEIQMKTLLEKFVTLRSFLKKIKDQRGEHNELEDLWARIVKLAYQAEYVIDLYLVKGSSDRRIELSLSNIIEKIKPIMLEVTRINHEKKYVTQAHSTAANVPSQAVYTTIGDDVVGFEDEAMTIMGYLVGGMKHRDVISIVGMPGLGKTTLAKKIYEEPSLVEHFHVRAWCSVSQIYRKKEVLLTILGDVITVNDEIRNLDDEELSEKLYRSLKGRRYLIIVDDLWEIEAWRDLVRPLPDDNNQSRILVTSRLENVAPKTKAGRKVHFLRQFSEGESWELFRKKLFEKESYSEDFHEVGKQIAKNCKGLPLAIVVVAGLLGKVKKRIDTWNEIAGSLSPHIFRDSESQCKAILELSYFHLPDHMKSCFLYLGAFSEDEEIPVKKLKWLWISEGFVRNSISMEDLAEEYFMDLVKRSLVIASTQSSIGRLKTCRVHDLVLEFCLEKARDERFLRVLNEDDGSNSLSIYDERRLIINFEVNDYITSTAGFGVRTLLHSPAFRLYIFLDTSFIFRNFKLLRVLDLAYASIGHYDFNGVKLLIHLRYLAIKSEESEFVSLIPNLWNLQFLLLKFRYPMVVPDSIWDMANLRHVHINRLSSLDVDVSRLKNFALDNLKTLSKPCLSYGDDAQNLLRRFPKLQKLKCIFEEYWEDSSTCYKFPVLDFLDQLISLKAISTGTSLEGERCVFKFPTHLQKLTLSHFKGIQWDEISKIGRTLGNLKVLKLFKVDAYDNDTWMVNDGDFPKLKYLKLRGIDHLRNWVASEDCFPILTHLVLDDLPDLEEIPACFGEICTLEMITVKDCKRSLDDSARIIQKEHQEEWQNEDLKVFINPREQDDE